MANYKIHGMRHIYLYLFSLIILMSCKSHKDNNDFDYIDLSFYNGWTDYYSVKILPSGETFLFNDKFKKGQTYLKYHFDNNSLDSIEKLARMIQKLKLDSSYEKHCADCGMYNLIIKYKNTKLRLYVYGLTDENESIQLPNNLVDYVLRFTRKYQDSIINDFKFESRTKQFYPPSPPPILKTDN